MQSVLSDLPEGLDTTTYNAWVDGLDQSIWGYDFNRHLVNSARLVGAIKREGWYIDLKALTF
jgi:hypothetical protein